MEYIAAGNVMVDTVHFKDGRENRNQIGGPALFAYSGIRLFTDDALLVCNVGQDFETYFGQWANHNQVCREGIKIKADTCNHSHLLYNDDGTYTSDKTSNPDYYWTFIENLGYLKTSPEEIEAHTSGGGVKGIYMAQNCDRVFWDRLGTAKKRDGFKMMWEIEGPFCKKEYTDSILHAMQYADMFSLNIQECRNLSGLESEDDNLAYLKTLPVDMILFRVGKKGLYTLQNGQAYFHPSAPVDRETDPTGCGNTSTGAAIYAYCNHPKDPVMVGIVANVAAAQNIRQFGAIPDFSAVRQSAVEQVQQLYACYPV